MNNMKNGAGFGSYAISLGSKVLRGGRMRKVGSQVVSYSPHVAEMFGTASRAVIGGLIAMGGVAAAPAMAEVLPLYGISQIEPGDANVSLTVDSGEEVAGSEAGIYGAVSGQGNIVLINNGTVNADVGSSTSLGRAGAEAVSGGNGNIQVINNGLLTGQDYGVLAGQATGASGLTEIINRGTILATEADGIAIVAVHALGVNGDIRVDNQQDLMGDLGVSVIHEGTGNITITNSGWIESADDEAIAAVHLGDGHIVITNTGKIESEDDDAINLWHQGTGNLTVNLQATPEEEGEGYLDNVVRSFDGDAVNLWHSSNGDINVNSTAGSIVAAEYDAFDVGHSGVGDINFNLAGEAGSRDGNIATVAHEGAGDINFNVLTGSDLSSSEDGISLNFDNRSGSGNINLTTELDSLIYAEYVALDIAHNGTGDVSLDIAGVVESSEDNAIQIDHNGTGKVSLEISGLVDSYYDTAMSIEHNGNGLVDVALASTAEVYASNSGLAVVRQNSNSRGATNVTTAADSFIRAGSNGIYVRNAAHGDVSFDLSGDIYTGYTEGGGGYRFGGNSGVYAVQSGRGNLTADLAGLIDASTNGLELYLSNSGQNSQIGDLSLDISEQGSIIAGDTGVKAINYRVGALNISNAGSIDAYQLGVIATHNGVGALNISNAGSIDAYQHGVIATHNGVGALEIANSGEIYSSFGGILATHNSAGLMRVENSGSIISNEPDFVPYGAAPRAGIYAERNAAGDLQISNKGENSIIQGFEGGIAAVHNDRENIVIDNAGDILGQTYEVSGPDDVIYLGAGIVARHNGEGDKSISITNSGTINAGVGIDAGFDCCEMDGELDINIISTGTIIANDYVGIRAFSDNGVVTIAANDVTSTAYEEVGIYASAGRSGGIAITANGKVQGDYAGVYAESYGAPVSLTIASTGQVQNLSGETDDLAVGLVIDYNDVASDITLINNGKLTGVVNLDNQSGGGSLVTINGLWDSQNGSNFFTNGEDKVVINGIWDARGSSNYFSNLHYVRMAVDPADYGDSVTIDAGGTLFIQGTVFDQLDLLQIKGTVDSKNGVANERSVTTGTIAFEQGSILSVDAGNNGAADSIQAGNVIINGGTLQLNFVGDSKPEVGQTYDVLFGATVEGEFDNTEIMNTAFRGWAIGYEEDGLDGEVVRLEYKQVRSFEDLALTPNNGGIADVLGDLNDESPLIEALLETPNEAAARKAYDMLSGDIHPGVRTALMEDSRLTRNAVLERLNAPQGGAVWGQLFANSGSNDGQSGQLKRDSWGFIAGGDLPLGEDAAVGIAAGYTSTDLEQRGVAADGEAETIHALAYVGGASGKLRYKAGVGYAWSNIETNRSVAFGDFSNRLRADYDANLFQAFAELGYRLPLAGGSVEPIANITHLSAKSDGFTETVGAAALTATSAKDSNTLTTVGARFETAQTGIFSVNGMVGWQHAFGKLAPVSSFRLADSDAFRVAGVAQSRNAAVAVIEGAFALSETIGLGVSYDGVIGSASKDHAAKLTLRVKF